MINNDTLMELPGRDVVGPDGDKIGSVETVYVDDATGDPAFALVKTGLFGLNSSFVPLADADYDGEALRTPHSKDKVKDAPNLDPGSHLSPEDEDEVFRYYGMSDQGGAPAGGPEPRTADTGTDAGRPDDHGAGTVGRDTSGPTDSAMTRSEEELHVGTSEREVGRARLRKHVVTEHVTTTVPVQREEVTIEREPITDDKEGPATDGPAISEEEHEVVLHAEEPVVEKRAVPKERVRLDKDVVTEQETVEGDVRREEIEVDDQAR